MPKPQAQRALSFDQFGKKTEASKEEVGRSKVELIMMREGLIGLPRDSLSTLLRQSLTPAELDKMFEDDSTQSFESLERRLKTPKKAATNDNIFKKPDNSKTLFHHEDTAKVVDIEEETDNKSAKPSPLKRSVSLSVLTPEVQVPEKQDEFKLDMEECIRNSPAVLLKSFSTINLTDENERGKMEVAMNWRDAREAYNEYVREREEIEAQLKNIMIEARERKERFKMTWGVSPAKINSLRSKCGQSVIIDIQKVEMSKGATELPADKFNDKENDPSFAQPDLIFSSVSMPTKENDKIPHEAPIVRVVDYSDFSDSDLSDNEDIANLEQVDMDMTGINSDGTPVTKPKKNRSVRFLNVTPQFKKPLRKSMIKVNIPIHLGSQASNIEFDEEGIFSRTKTHVDTPRYAKTKGSDTMATVQPTPMALKKISDKAQEELRSLYAEHDYSHSAREKIDFDDI